MSPRHAIQKNLVNFLSNRKTKKGNPYFDAPYGILEGIEQRGKGKVRTIAFGVSRYLDATIFIWSEKKITVDGAGPLLYKFKGNFSSPLELINHFIEEIK